VKVHPDPADTSTLREVFGTFATGVTVLTVGGQSPHGMTANSFTTVSMDPPLVLVCVKRDAVMHDSLADAGGFAVNVLASHQEPVARYFADHSRPLGQAQFEAVEWAPGERTGAPLIGDAFAHIECDLWRTYDGGDHSIFIGRLVSLGRQADDALLFFHGRFRHLDPERSEATA
jgi:flavin reductase